MAQLVVDGRLSVADSGIPPAGTWPARLGSLYCFPVECVRDVVDTLEEKREFTCVCVFVDLVFLGILDFTMWMHSLLKIVLCEQNSSEAVIKRGVEILFPRRLAVVRRSAIGAKEDD